MPDRVTPPPRPVAHVFVYIEGGALQMAAADVPIELHVLDMDNHEGLDAEGVIEALYDKFDLDGNNVTEDLIKVENNTNDHVDHDEEEPIHD